MNNFHIEIDIDKDGDMLICEDGCTGEHYRVDGALDDLIDQITTCLADYLHDESDDMEENNMTYQDFLKKMEKDPPRNDSTTFNLDAKPNNIMSTDGELKQWQKDVMEKDYAAEKLQKNSLYGKMCYENDPVNHPSHYTDGKIEVIDFIEDKKLNFHLANAVKYISRAGKKDPSKEIEDLKKARWYLDRYIQKLEERNNEVTT